MDSFDHNFESDPNQFHFDDVERANAEIAAYHLDKLLGFRRAIPTFGRELNITRDLKMKTEDKDITYFTSPADNLCFIGTCEQYCDFAHAICASSDMIKGSVQLYLPYRLKLREDISFYRRRHKEGETASWQDKKDYCDVVKRNSEYNHGRRLPDLVDLHIFDYVTGNMLQLLHLCRMCWPGGSENNTATALLVFHVHKLGWKVIKTATVWSIQRHSTTTPILPHLFSYIWTTAEGAMMLAAICRITAALDACIRASCEFRFGNSQRHDEDILLPLTQCCVVRPSTVKTLLSFYRAKVPLSKQLELALQDDPISPVLSRKHLDAIDHRVVMVLGAVAECLKASKDNLHKVFMNNFSFSSKRNAVATEIRTINPALEYETKDEESAQLLRIKDSADQRRKDVVSLRSGPDDETLPLASEPDDVLITTLQVVTLYEISASDEECPKEMLYKDHRDNKKLPMDTNWDKFYAQISTCHIHQKDSHIVKNLLNDISTQTITAVENFEGYHGTQVKLKLTFEKGGQAIFKPMRFDPNYESNPNHFHFDDFERPHAEIAAFHLDSLLGFRRALPTVGRVISISDIEAKTKKYQRIEYFQSPDNNLCFVGNCKKYCDTAHAICGKEGVIHGSVQVWLPPFFRTMADSPYAEMYDNYQPKDRPRSMFCESVLKKTEPFNTGRLLIDVVELSIFDYITGNQDRNQYEKFSFLDLNDPDAFIYFMDYGKAFGDPHNDYEEKILAPLTQCCVFRPSTVKTLLKFYSEGPSLAHQLRDSLKKDLHYPHIVLATKYLVAVDRRVEKVLRAMAECIKKHDGKLEEVLMNRMR